MKIGIISMQRVPNYGSFLQAMGLKSLLEKMGHEVVFIDYKPGLPVVPYSKGDLISYYVGSEPVIAWCRDWFRYNIQGKRKFVYAYRFKYLKQLGITYRHNYNENVDVAIIGSDEVFNCLQKGPNVGFSPMLFGDGVSAKKVISYAASFGYTDISGLEKYGIKEKVKQYLTDFASLSVRDQHSLETVFELTGIEPEVNLDPVLMADYSLPKKVLPYKDYVVLYTYKTRKYTNDEMETIKAFCEKHQKKLVSIGNSQPWVENKVLVEPLEMLAYIRNADFIITDTFHGTVFSIKYNKKFATLVRPDNTNKLYDLLNRLKKKDRIIKTFGELDEVFDRPVDYAETNSIIEAEKKHTRQYLENAIRVD